jgi:PAS domain S-box-containing protein
MVEDVRVLQQTTDNTIVGHFQAPALPEGISPFLDLTYQRTFYLQGQKSMNQFALLLIITFLVMNVPIFLALERFVNRPITKLSDSVNKVAASGGTIIEIPLEGYGEISQLAGNIQNMLIQISKLTAHEKTQEEELSTKMNMLQQQNQEMTDTKRAMQNLLEDSRLLEKQIKDERDRVQAIIDSMGEGLLAIDKESRLTIINPTAERILDVKAEEVLGKKWSEVVTTLKGDQESPTEERTFLQTLTTGKAIVTTLEANHYYRLKNGRVFPVTSITAPLKSGDEIIGAAKVFRDATREKEQQSIIEQTVKDRTAEIHQKNEALQHAQDDISKAAMQIIEEKARLTASIVSLSLGFVLIDTNEQIVIANPAINKILGLTTDVRNFSEIGDRDANGVRSCRYCAI